MADRYWVGGTGSWTPTSTTNWSATSGGAGGASVPTNVDNVFFNSASSGASYTVTLSGGNTTCQNLTVASPATGVVTIAGTTNLFPYGNVDVVAATVWTHSGQLNFGGTAVNPATCAMRPTVAAIFTSSAGKTVNLTNNFTTTSTFIVQTVGFTLVLNGFNVQAGLVQWNAGSINLGANTLTSTGDMQLSPLSSTLTRTTGWLQMLDSAGTGSTLTLSGTSTLAMFIRIPTTASANAKITSLWTSTTLTIDTLQFESPPSTGQRELVITQTNRVINNLNLGTVGADPSRRIFVRSGNTGVSYTISNPTSATLVNVDFWAVGLSVARSGTSLGGCGATSNITFTAAKTVYWSLLAGGLWTQNAFATTSGGAPALANWPLPQDTLIFDNAGLNSGATITNSGIMKAMPGFNASSRTNPMTFNVTGANLDVKMCGTVYNLPTAFTFTSAIYVNGITFTNIVTNFIASNSTTPMPIIRQDIGSNITLGASSFSAGLTLISGTFTLNNFSLTLSEAFNYNLTTATRTIAFGSSGVINVSRLTGTVVTGNVTNFTVTGTGNRDINLTGASAAAQTRTIVTTGSLSEANTFNLNVSAGAAGSLLTFTGTNNFQNLNFTGYSGGTTAAYVLTAFGNVTLSSTMTLFSGTALIFSKTSGTQTYTSNGVSFAGSALTKTGAATLTLNNATALGTVSITAGTLQLNNFTHTFDIFGFGGAALTTAVVLDWGSVGSTITMTVNNSSFQNLRTTQSSVTWTGAGTKTINFTSSANVGTRICFPGTNLTEALAPNVNFTGAPAAGTAAVTLTNALGTTLYKSLTFATGGNYIWNNVASTNFWIYGNFTLASTVVINYTGGIFFRNTSGTAIFTSAGRTIPGNLGQNGVGGTVQQADAAICSNVATGFTVSGGTWNLNNFTLTTTKFASTITAARTLAFGTGSMTLTSTATGSVFTIDNGTGFLVTGTPTVNVTSATASISKLITCKSMAENGTLNFNVTGPSTQTVDFSQGAATPAGVRAINLTGFLGSVTSIGGNNINIYGSLTVDAATTWSAITSPLVFSNTSGTAILNTAGKTMGPITMAGAGGTLQFGAAVTYSVGGTGILTLTAGTINFNGFTGTFKSFSSSNSNVRTLNIASTTFLFTSPNAAIWDVATSTNFTLTATSGVINMQAPAGTYTFNGGGLSYPTVLFVNAGVNPTFIVTGNNTFATFGSASGTRTLSLTAGSTQTITGAFNYAGLAGSPNQVATLNSTVAGTQATISKASGTVTANLLSIKDSNATGGATWDAYTNGNNINGGNNSGWLFAAVVFLANAFFNFF